MMNYILDKDHKFFQVTKLSKDYIYHSKSRSISKKISPQTKNNKETNKIKFTKKIINELFTKLDKKGANFKKINYNRTNTNSPVKKLNINRHLSHKVLFINKKNNQTNYNNRKIINKIKFNYSNSISNNMTTNFSNSVNNTTTSVTNNNSNNISHKKNHNIKEIRNNYIYLNFLYKHKSFKIQLNRDKNGLWLADKINKDFNLDLSSDQIHNLALDLTEQINNIIYCIANLSNITNFSFVIDINKLIEKNKIYKEKKYKICLKYSNNNYYFFINNNKDDIEEMVDIMINNIIHKEKYDISALREEIIQKINNAITLNNSKSLIDTSMIE